MAVQNAALIAFNRGLVSKLALARTDLKRTALSAQVMTNWMPRVLGSMMIRPGLGFLGDTRSDLKARFVEFIFGLNDTALIELTNQKIRIWINDALMSRAAVSTAVVNGTFAANIANWTDNDEAGAVSLWGNFSGGGDMELIGTGTAAAIRTQQVNVAGADQGVEHALRIVIPEQGTLAGPTRATNPVTLKVGSTDGDDDYIRETSLGLGTHSLAFTPGATFWIQLSNRRATTAYISECTIEASGVVEIPAPWLEADLRLIRYDASGDITFTATSGYAQYSIERRSTTSWSVVLYEPEDGPFLVENISTTTITPSGLTGTITLTASTPIFRSTHLGALFRVSSIGQTVSKNGAALNDATDPMRVTGVGTFRAFTIILSGFFDGVRTMILERSFDLATWTAVPGMTWVAAVTTSFNDGLDNQIVYYRLRISVIGGAGATLMTLQIGTGSITGIAKVIQFVSRTVVFADVLKTMGSASASAVWWEGSWSPFRGFPSSVAFHQGRLCWAGKSNQWGSVSDGFYSFDDTVLGDAGPISRTIGSGPVDNINWLLAMQRLFLGADMSEFQVVTSSLDEPITPTNFQIRQASTQGSATVAASKVDARGVFVRRGGSRLFELSLDPVAGDYASTDLTALVPDMFENFANLSTDKSIIDIGVQRLPDTRVHCVKADGTVGIMIYDKVEQVTCWINLETDGFVEDVSILPGTPEDLVYYSVRRTINGVTKRFLEIWAGEADARGSTFNAISDASVVYIGAPATVIPVAHLEGKSVAVWADGLDVGHTVNADGTHSYSHTVSGGTITLATAASTVIVGLPYLAQWKSAKLAYAAQQGTALLQKKNVSAVGVVMADAHAQGLQYGPDFQSLDGLPLIEDGKLVAPDSIWSEYDKATFVFPGSYDTDSRVCLQAASPRPVTVCALVVTVATNEKT